MAVSLNTLAIYHQLLHGPSDRVTNNVGAFIHGEVRVKKPRDDSDVGDIDPGKERLESGCSRACSLCKTT